MSVLLDNICGSLEEESPAARVELKYWKSVRDAHKNGKKLVLFAGPVPAELLYAADCVPLYADMLPLRIARDRELLRAYINDVEAHVSPNLCSASKSVLGALRQGELEIDAFIRAPVGCPSFKSAYDEARMYLGVPYYEFDTPTRLSERNIDFMADGMYRALDFLEGVTGRRPEPAELKRLMEQHGRCKELLDKCAAARSARPCPMSSHMVELGRLMPALGPTEDMEALLKAELETCQKRTEGGESPCSGGEQHRAYFLQSPLWCGGELRGFLEEKYATATVHDGLGFAEGPLYGDFSDDKDCFRELARALFTPPALHGGTLGAPLLMESCRKTVSEYSPDVLLFLGDRWCRQTWAVTKMLSDEMQESFGLSMFMIDADGIDPDYKDEKQLKTLISEYMDAVICGR